MIGKNFFGFFETKKKDLCVVGVFFAVVFQSKPRKPLRSICRISGRFGFRVLHLIFCQL
jgi:hypothetical protein